MTTNAKQTVTGRPLATLDLPRVVSALINLTGAVIAALTNNPHFPGANGVSGRGPRGR